VIRHSPAAIAVSSSCSQQASRRFIRSGGSRPQCVARIADPSEKRIAMPIRAGMIQGAQEEVDTLLAHGSFIRRFVLIVDGKPRCRSSRGPTNRCTAGSASKRCDPANHGIANSSRSPAGADILNGRAAHPRPFFIAWAVTGALLAATGCSSPDATALPRSTRDRRPASRSLARHR